MSSAVELENVSKQYRLGLVSTGTLSHDLNRWWATRVLHREDPYITIGDVNDRTVKGNSDYVWALRDINLKIEQGEVLGIIGRNGSGKSTLLKLLSRVTAPTTGEIRVNGRIGSLLEVGTGFHPEMTGLENIYMNGAVLGMSRAEIKSKLDEIVAFSGCERYLETPVKRYSTGMVVRLAFAVAAHLDPEILVVDEVLAVGDAEFQKKAIGKMDDISRNSGRTVLFVSHNMTAVKSLCKNAIILRDGLLVSSGDVDTIVTEYLKGDAELVNHKVFSEAGRSGSVLDGGFSQKIGSSEEGYSGQGGGPGQVSGSGQGGCSGQVSGSGQGGGSAKGGCSGQVCGPGQGGGSAKGGGLSPGYSSGQGGGFSQGSSQKGGSGQMEGAVPASATLGVGTGVELLEIGVRPVGGNWDSIIRADNAIEVYVRYKVLIDNDDLWVTLLFKNSHGDAVFTSSSDNLDRSHPCGEYAQTTVIPANFLNWGNYTISFYVFSTGMRRLLKVTDAVAFTVSNVGLPLGSWMGRVPGDITPSFEISEELV